MSNNMNVLIMRVGLLKIYRLLSEYYVLPVYKAISPHHDVIIMDSFDMLI